MLRYAFFFCCFPAVLSFSFYHSLSLFWRLYLEWTSAWLKISLSRQLQSRRAGTPVTQLLIRGNLLMNYFSTETVVFFHDILAVPFFFYVYKYLFSSATSGSLDKKNWERIILGNYKTIRLDYFKAWRIKWTDYLEMGYTSTGLLSWTCNPFWTMIRCNTLLCFQSPICTVHSKVIPEVCTWIMVIRNPIYSVQFTIYSEKTSTIQVVQLE